MSSVQQLDGCLTSDIDRCRFVSLTSSKMCIWLTYFRPPNRFSLTESVRGVLTKAHPLLPNLRRLWRGCRVERLSIFRTIAGSCRHVSATYSLTAKVRRRCRVFEHRPHTHHTFIFILQLLPVLIELNVMFSQF